MLVGLGLGCRAEPNPLPERPSCPSEGVVFRAEPCPEGAESFGVPGFCRGPSGPASGPDCRVVAPIGGIPSGAPLASTSTPSAPGRRIAVLGVWEGARQGPAAHLRAGLEAEGLEVEPVALAVGAHGAARLSDLAGALARSTAPVVLVPWGFAGLGEADPKRQVGPALGAVRAALRRIACRGGVTVAPVGDDRAARGQAPEPSYPAGWAAVARPDAEGCSAGAGPLVVAVGARRAREGSAGPMAIQPAALDTTLLGPGDGYGLVGSTPAAGSVAARLAKAEAPSAELAALLGALRPMAGSPTVELPLAGLPDATRPRWVPDHAASMMRPVPSGAETPILDVGTGERCRGVPRVTVFTEDEAQRRALCGVYAAPAGPLLAVPAVCRRCVAVAEPGTRKLRLHLDLAADFEGFVEFKTGKNRVVHPLPPLQAGIRRLEVPLPGPVPKAMVGRLFARHEADYFGEELEIAR